MRCLFGFIDYAGALSVTQKSRLIRELSIAAEVRGTDATGIAYNTSRGLQIYKRPLAAHRLHLRIPAEAHVVMGHTRMTTQGSAKKNYNNHPFFGCVKGKRFALAHNGVIWNDLELRRIKHLPRTKVQTDSFIAVIFSNGDITPQNTFKTGINALKSDDIISSCGQRISCFYLCSQVYCAQTGTSAL